MRSSLREVEVKAEVAGGQSFAGAVTGGRHEERRRTLAGSDETEGSEADGDSIRVHAISDAH